MHKISLIIYGAGDHAKVIIDLVEKLNQYNIVGLIDDAKPDGSLVLNYSVLGDQTILDQKDKKELLHAFVAIGNSLWRREKSNFLTKNDFNLISLLHPFTSLGKNVTYQSGTCICAGVVIDTGTTIGKGVLINDKTEIGYDCHINDYAHIAPGVNCGDNVCIDTMSFIGMGATLQSGIKIGAHSFVCIGSHVTKDVPDYVKMAGNPARVIEKLY